MTFYSRKTYRKAQRGKKKEPCTIEYVRTEITNSAEDLEDRVEKTYQEK